MASAPPHTHTHAHTHLPGCDRLERNSRPAWEGLHPEVLLELLCFPTIMLSRPWLETSNLNQSAQEPELKRSSLVPVLVHVHAGREGLRP